MTKGTAPFCPLSFLQVIIVTDKGPWFQCILNEIRISMFKCVGFSIQVMFYQVAHCANDIADSLVNQRIDRGKNFVGPLM